MGTYRKVIESAPDIRTIARTSLRGRWKEAVIFFAIYYVLSGMICNILDLFFTLEQTMPYELADGTTATETMSVTYGSSIYTFLITGPLSYAMSLFLLQFVRGGETAYQMIFEGFSKFGKAFLIFLITSVKTALWAMLLFVPGVIAAYRYSQAYYVMIDHPEFSANECIEESKRIMANNKAGLFYLDLTFIGWSLLSTLIGVGLTFTNTSTGIIAVISAAIASIPVFFVDAYSNVARTYFYELAIDNVDIIEEAKPVENDENHENNDL